MTKGEKWECNGKVYTVDRVWDNSVSLWEGDGPECGVLSFFKIGCFDDESAEQPKLKRLG